MDIHELFLNCRKGDLSKVKHLYEKKDVDLNVRDEYDGTPLYYACLCGHMNLVEYLLTNGALCDANTFEAERCHFAALTNDIRRRLRNFKITEANRLVSRNQFEEFLRKVVERGQYSDFTFTIHTNKYSVHRGIMCARSPYFSEVFLGKCNSEHSADINNPQVDKEAFKAVIHFLYTGRINAPTDILDNTIELAEQFQLPDLEERLQSDKKMLTESERRRPGSGAKVVSIVGEDLRVSLKKDFMVLAEQALPAELRHVIPPSDLPPLPRSVSYFPDVCFIVDKVRFHCHKVFFAGRSEYFSAMFRDHFGEAHHEQGDVDSMAIHDVAPDVFAHVVRYVYNDSVKLTNDTAYEVLEAAELYLMFGLKKLSSEYLAETANSENVVDLIRISRTFNLPSLEDSCLAYISGRLEEVIDSEDFHDLVLEDAAQVKGRQETDTIPIIDDLRFLVTRKDLVETQRRLRLIDSLLDKLGLEA